MIKTLLATSLLALAFTAHPADAAQQHNNNNHRRGVRGLARPRQLQKNKDAAPPEEPDAITIMDILSDRDNQDTYSVLAGLLKDAEFVNALEGDGPFTLLAPTNAAFEALDAETLEAVENDPFLLQQVLQYHVLPDVKYMASDLAVVEPGSSFGTLNTANNITVNATTVSLDLGNTVQSTTTVQINDGAATVTDADNTASNGVIHNIDAVLIPLETQTQAPEPDNEEDGEVEPEEEEEDNEGGIALEDLLGCVQGSLADDPTTLINPDILECGTSLLPEDGDATDLFDIQGVLNCLGTSLGCEAEVAAANAATGFGGEDVISTPLDNTPPGSTNQAGQTLGDLYDGK